VRQLARAKRVAASSPGAGQTAAKALIDHFPPELARRGVVAGYWPLGSEIDSRPLLLAMAEAGATIALPHIGSRDAPPVFRRWIAGDRLVADAYGIMAPGLEAEALVPVVVLTPLLAFDRRGGRLGQGGGHYDKLLAALKPSGVLAIGLAFASQEMVTVPMGPLDQALDWIVTEREAIRV
jgi:5-formyltetrahydrofolate cyclo-ligase